MVISLNPTDEQRHSQSAELAPADNLKALENAQPMSPLQELSSLGQSFWLDYIRRDLIHSGELKRLVEHDGLGGVTSNPAIFEKAFSGSEDYSRTLAKLQQEGLAPMAIYEKLAIRDIQDAADVLRPVYERTGRRDGYVSLEVSPFLAHDTEGTLEQARRLWSEVARKNLLIKVPATPEGLPAIEQLISEGINVNITLLFSQQVYEQVAQAYISGLQKRAAKGEDVSGVASVASFFISRIDSAVDSQIEARISNSADSEERSRLESLCGKVAIANGKLTYQKYKEIFASDAWKTLAGKGAQTQRVLWASTSTKNPQLSDVLYVEELIGPDTVDTIPPATMEAFRDHGRPRASLEEGVAAAQATMEGLAQAGISMDETTADLLKQGVRLFAEAFDKLLSAVDVRCPLVAAAKVNPQSYSLPAELKEKVDASLDDWLVNGKIRRLWDRDTTLWTRSDESKWLGWLGIVEDQLADIEHLTQLADDVKAGDFSHAVVLGMGGSSMCPEVLALTFGRQEGFPELHVLDSTDPAQVITLKDKIDLAKTLFIVASKSGSTLEPNIFKQYFFERVAGAAGHENASKQFVIVTDPGSHLDQVAQSENARHIFHGVPSIGGRYSALSDFGMVPAAAIGIDTERFLDRADEMAVSCSACLPARDNPGVVLGNVLGVLANEGRDKVTLIASPGIHGLGAWLEQLLAESTGKLGKGLIPVDREPLGPPAAYGDDRVFVYLRLDTGVEASQDQAVSALETAGQPLVRINIPNIYDLGQEFFRWEIATAVAGSVMGINPFDQPDVEASKVATRNLTSEFEQSGSLPPEEPILEDDGIRLFADDKNASALAEAAGGDKSLDAYVRAHLGRLSSGDYLAFLAYIEMNPAHAESLRQVRKIVRDKTKAATCLGFGPRFLHSTGQAYKGGPNTGVVLQITCDDAADLPVPGQKYTFGIVKAAQARGDFKVLAERDRRALRVHLGTDVQAGLARLSQAVTRALG